MSAASSCYVPLFLVGALLTAGCSKRLVLSEPKLTPTQAGWEISFAADRSLESIGISHSGRILFAKAPEGAVSQLDREIGVSTWARFCPSSIYGGVNPDERSRAYKEECIQEISGSPGRFLYRFLMPYPREAGDWRARPGDAVSEYDLTLPGEYEFDFYISGRNMTGSWKIVCNRLHFHQIVPTAQPKQSVKPMPSP